MGKIDSIKICYNMHVRVRVCVCVCVCKHVCVHVCVLECEIVSNCVPFLPEFG